jgi:hypothetical protein
MRPGGLWENLEVEIKSCDAVGDRLLVLLNQYVQGREGIAVHHQWGHLFELADDRIRRVTAYDSWEAASEAAGGESAVGGG